MLHGQEAIIPLDSAAGQSILGGGGANDGLLRSILAAIEAQPRVIARALRDQMLLAAQAR